MWLKDVRVTFVREYLPAPKRSPEEEFWCSDRVEHIRRLALTGRPWRIFRKPIHRYRILDRIRFRGFEDEELDVSEYAEDDVADVDLTHVIKFNRVQDAVILEAPVYFADMSFGALSGNPNIAFVEVAERIKAVSGLGEGGVHPVIRQRYKRYFVQWASGRFGIGVSELTSGVGITIKIGQGAKPGIGGHLPGKKVTEVISRVRRIPPGVDALSPAPHHDIYSIEDLGQRIWALKEATGKPVFVKVAATNYVPYVVSGIARMGADGAIIDGHGAGTGATPIVVRDHVGIPIELAVAAADAILRREGLRENFTIVASGRVASADDAAKLIALGADMVSIGTAGLIAMGCILCHTCNLGRCPAGLASSIENGNRIIDLDFAVERLHNFMRGFLTELKLILRMLGIRRLRDLVSRRDLLAGYNIDEEVNQILRLGELKSTDPLPYRYDEGETEFKRPKYVLYYRKLVETGDIVVIGAGSDAPPEVEKPRKVLDWLRLDGAQVTRPSIDPYREFLDLRTELFNGEVQIAAPLVLRPPPEYGARASEFSYAAHLAGILCDLSYLNCGLPSRHRSAIIYCRPERDIAALCVKLEDLREAERAGRPVLLRVPSDLDYVLKLAETGTLIRVDGVIVDSDLGCVTDPEIVLVWLDKYYRREHVRYEKSIIVSYWKIRDAGDITKLIALGADAVEVSFMLRFMVKPDEPRDVLVEKLLRVVTGLKREIALLAGAAGVYNLQSTLVGNRELLRVLDLDKRIRSLLDVKIAGTW